MIKAVIFDVGGVYLKGSFVDFVNKAYKILGIKGEYLNDKLMVFDSDYNRGKTSIEDTFRRLFNMPISDEQMKSIIELWTTTWTQDEEMRELIIKLKEKYKLAVLSNSDLVNSRRYAEKGWYSYFDILVLSHEEGLLKPEQRIYDITLDRLGLPAEECVFIDDQSDALEPAKKMGIKVIQYKSTEQLKKELKNLGIEF